MRPMRYLIHSLIISGFLVGSDYVVNDGADTANAIRSLELQALWNDVKLQNYHAVAQIKQEALYYRPQLAMAQTE